ncbi:integron integrase [Methylophilus glucosoxydans]|uniref:Integron integrase n=1 Tax=Methylophilus glucosoxydans TaxID=752553 RepID=A0ABW3GIH8_9PROT
MENTPEVKPAPKLFPLIVERLRSQNYSNRTEEAYIQWIKRFILFHDKRHPRDMGTAEIEAFLNHLAVEKKVAASTQSQAKSALLFLYDEVLERNLPKLENLTKLPAKKELPVVLSKQEVQAVLSGLEGTMWLMVSLLYGSGLRVMECLRLRVADIDFDRLEILVRDPQGYKNRTTLLPGTLVHPLKTHLASIEALHAEDLSKGLGEVWMPEGLAKRYPNAGKDWQWQYVFPSSRLSVAQQSGGVYRHHADEKPIQRAVKNVAKQLGIKKTVTPNTLRHSFATHLLEGGHDLQTVQRLLGHANEANTKVYAQLVNTGGSGVSSPLDVIKPIV